jgi:hypothetical protein
MLTLLCRQALLLDHAVGGVARRVICRDGLEYHVGELGLGPLQKTPDHTMAFYVSRFAAGRNFFECMAFSASIKSMITYLVTSKNDDKRIYVFL